MIIKTWLWAKVSEYLWLNIYGNYDMTVSQVVWIFMVIMTWMWAKVSEYLW